MQKNFVTLPLCTLLMYVLTSERQEDGEVHIFAHQMQVHFLQEETCKSQICIFVLFLALNIWCATFEKKHYRRGKKDSIE